MDFSKLLNVILVCQNWYLDFSKLLHEFVKIDTWICHPNWYMDLSKLLHGYFKVVSWIGHSCSMYFSAIAKHNQDWQRFQCLLKRLLWTKGVEWVKVIDALGPLCLCFLIRSSARIWCYWLCTYCIITWSMIFRIGKIFNSLHFAF